MPFIDSADNDRKNKFPKSRTENVTQKNSEKNSVKYQGKKSLMWIIIGLIISLIFFGWLFLFKQGLLTTNTNTKGWDRVKESFQNLLNVVKTGLHLSTGENKTLTTDEKKIKELENKVFPQFENTQNK